MTTVMLDVLELQGEGVRVQVSLQGSCVMLEVAVAEKAETTVGAGLTLTRMLELRPQDAVRLGRTMEAWGKQLRATLEASAEGGA